MPAMMNTMFGRCSRGEFVKIYLLIALLVCGGILGCSSPDHSPDYSFLQIKKSLKERDKYLFEKYVDIDGIAEKTVEDDSNFSVFEKSKIRILKSVAKSLVEKKFESFWQEQPGFGYCRKVRGDFLIKRSYLNRNGEVAFLGVEMLDPEVNEKILIEFQLDKTEDYWKISKISNLDKLAEDLARVLRIFSNYCR